MAEPWDCIVIGVGGMGSAACDVLARRGCRVLGLEQHQVAHDRGSSHGESRIIRQCYFEHPDYVPLLLESYRLWHELERRTGQTLLYRVGLLISGLPEGEAVSGAKLAARQHGLALEDLSTTEAGRRFPIFRLPHTHHCVYEPQAGYLLAEHCVRTHWESARAAGAEVHEHEAVQSWDVTDSGIVVHTSHGHYTTRRLVVTGGAWASRLLRDLQLPLQVTRKVAAWFPAPPQRCQPSAQMPTFYIERPEGAFYGFPSLDGQTIKAAEHSGAEPVADPATLDRTVTAADLGRLQRFAADVLPEVSREPARTSVCMYTLTPDQHFVIDRHPQHPEVVFAAGFSGHGFKFCPVVGQAVADLALDGATSLPIGFLGLGRFQGTDSESVHRH